MKPRGWKAMKDEDVWQLARGAAAEIQQSAEDEYATMENILHRWMHDAIREAVKAEAARAEKAEARVAELEAERDLLALVQRATEANGGQP